MKALFLALTLFLAVPAVAMATLPTAPQTVSDEGIAIRNMLEAGDMVIYSRYDLPITGITPSWAPRVVIFPFVSTRAFSARVVLAALTALRSVVMRSQTNVWSVLESITTAVVSNHSIAAESVVFVANLTGLLITSIWAVPDSQVMECPGAK